MKLVRPVSEEKRRELEQELEFQKKRFNEATQISARKIQTGFSILNWVHDYPLQSAGLLLVGGFIAIQIFYPKDRSDLRPKT